MIFGQVRDALLNHLLTEVRKVGQIMWVIEPLCLQGKQIAKFADLIYGRNLEENTFTVGDFVLKKFNRQDVSMGNFLPQYGVFVNSSTHQIVIAFRGTESVLDCAVNVTFVDLFKMIQRPVRGNKFHLGSTFNLSLRILWKL
jgi:hypothetical protein